MTDNESKKLPRMAHISDPICYELRLLRDRDMDHVRTKYAKEKIQEELKILKLRNDGA